MARTTAAATQDDAIMEPACGDVSLQHWPPSGVKLQ
jgi:hypothetical protein